MFVFEAVLLTFMTTPLVSVLYPPDRRVRVDASGAPRLSNVASIEGATVPKLDHDRDRATWKTRFTVVLDKIEHLPGMMALTQLIQTAPAHTPDVDIDNVAPDRTIDSKKSPEMFLDALRLIELSDRTSAVMKSSAADSLVKTDPLLGIFRMFGELHDIDVCTSLAIVTYDDLAYSVAEHATNNASDLILLPWLPPHASAHDPVDSTIGTPRASTHISNPFDAFFGSRTDKTASAIHSHFVRGVFAKAKTDVALFVDRGHAHGEARTAGSMQHIFLPFFGGPDDRAALDFVVQLCANRKITATVMKVVKNDANSDINVPDAAYAGADAVAKQEADIVAANIRDYGLTVASVRLVFLSDVECLKADGISRRLLVSLIPCTGTHRDKHASSPIRPTV